MFLSQMSITILTSTPLTPSLRARGSPKRLGTRSIPAPTVRTHGLAWDNGILWCVGSSEREIYKMDPKDGKLLAKIKLTMDDPEPHGLDLFNGAMWYCDAASGWICRLA